MRVLVVAPLTGLSPATVAHRQATLNALAWPGTEVVFRTAGGPVSIESRAEEALAAVAAIEGIRRAGAEGGWDAAIVWCAADPGVHAARELVDFPVVGPGEAACALAALVSTSFITVSATEGDRILAEELVHRGGFERKVAGSYALGVPVLSLHDDEEATTRRTVELIRGAGADAAALLCLGFTGMGQAISRLAEVPVIDAGAAALQVAQLLAAGGYRFSRKSYPVPRKPAVAGDGLPVGGGGVG